MRILLTITMIAFMSASAVRAEEPAAKHWSLSPRTKPAVPQFEKQSDRDWINNPIDAFVLEKLKRADLKPSLAADPRTLIRRLSFDLTGLPPTPDEIESFLKDSRATPRAAYEKLVDRLLASPRYGERWGRHWLDVVRFAETEGFEYDRHLPGAWRYRDYVIDTFNRDKPFDRFIVEQIAGDEREPGNRDLQIAAGFHRLGPVRRNAGNQAIAFSRDEVLTEMADSIGLAFLGTTFGCARCHDHKFDPIPQADYFRLQAFLAAVHEHEEILAPKAEADAWRKQSEKIQRELQSLQKNLSTLTGEAKTKAETRIRELEMQIPPRLATISTVKDNAAERTPIHILRRGNADKKDRQVGPRLPSAFVSDGVPEMPADVANPRTLLARWIASADNPLTARVIVNRIWAGHFGRGIVDSPNDFGVNGSRPSHPELLDWLANEFVAGGWRIKPSHKLIVMSNAYRQASIEVGAKPPVVDPDNRLLWSSPIRRLDAEQIRDSMLMIAGRLNEKRGGPSVIVPVDADLVKLLYAPAQWAVTKDVREHDRRSVYLIVKRNLRLPFLESFDQPDAQTSCGMRESSTHSLQALELLNGRLANNLAADLAERLKKEAGDDGGKQVERAFALTAGRTPTDREKERSLTFLKGNSLKEFSLAMFNLNAFLYAR